ncbi:MAG: hypothetical protein KJ799_12755 [Bacteroidetes bacterium]|nr:hypothetical protein [Bacteroidota bacterium]MBU1679872.1 hypothetical protein [Bacteroidota bacterium]MBU2507574.1 hypothetical protein [Bacteroidota bacterium]
MDLVFVGFGIIASEYDYNDYTYADVEGKIVVMIEGEPASEDDAYFVGMLPTVYSLNESRQRIALARGAYGSIIIPVNSPANYDWERLKIQYKFEDVRLAFSAAGSFGILWNLNKANILFDSSGYDFEDIMVLVEKGELLPIELNKSLTIPLYKFIANPNNSLRKSKKE